MSAAPAAEYDSPAQVADARAVASYVRRVRDSRILEAHTLSAGVLADDVALAAVLRELADFLSQTGTHLDLQHIPATLARGGTIGRIGVPHDATNVMLGRRLVIGANRGADPLLPLSRLWRGLQRRADVLADVRQCATLPGSAAARAGNERDVVLFSQRIVDRAAGRSGEDGASAYRWSRARQVADLAYRLAATEQRELLVALPVGRGTGSQRYFTDALERNARQHRLPPPRTVKAGLLSALLTGARGCQRWLVTSVMPIDELIAMTDEAIGDTGPWPVHSIGVDASFFDLPATRTAHENPVAGLLVLIGMLQRIGHTDRARAMLEALRVTSSAVVRMEEELGTVLNVPVSSFLAGVLANWGRAPISFGVRDRRRVPRVAETATSRPSASEAGAVA